MNTIYKYDLSKQLSLGNELCIPVSSKFLSVQIDPKNDNICMWYLVSTDNPTMLRKIHIFGTGNPLPETIDCMKHCGTVISRIGMVWHIFEELA